jgi:hypothetical protein
MTSYPEAVVAQAQRWVGYVEGPGNRNMFSAGLGRPPEAWCQDFVQFVSATAGFKQPYATAAVVAIGHWAQQHGLWVASTQATPGCQICYDWNNGDGAEPRDWQLTHTGFYIGGGHTIEGNTGNDPNGVHEKPITLGAADIWGAINWPRYWGGQGGTGPVPVNTNRFAGYPQIQSGSTGDIVRTFQRDVGIVLGHGPDADGEFGPLTEAACREFQTASRIEVDGQCGTQTWAALDVALDKLGR